MSKPIRLGIAGLGTVGVGTVRILQEQAELLARRAGRTFGVVAVSRHWPRTQTWMSLSS